MLQPMDDSVRPQRSAEPALGPASATQERDGRSTRAVIDNHLERFGARDLEGILSDYAPDAILFTPGGVLRGVDAIRELFRGMLAEFAKPGATFALAQLAVEGEHGFILWTAETADNAYELGTDTFVVRAGKIRVQSFAGKITPKRG